MPKKNKDWRKVKGIKGTIFDKAREDDTVAMQRRCGFFVLSGINPAAVAKGSATVESIGDGRVRVYYEAIHSIGPVTLTVREAQRLPIPPGVECERGGYKKHHKVTRIQSIDALRSEVL